MNLEGKYIGVIKCAVQCGDITLILDSCVARQIGEEGSKCARVTLFLSDGLSARALQAFDLFRTVYSVKRNIGNKSHPKCVL